MNIPYAKPSINDDDRKAVADVMADRWLTKGPIIEQFEAAVCEYTGAKYCVSLPNGTIALQALIMLAPGQRMFSIPAICYVALPNMLFLAQKIIYPVDIDDEYLSNSAVFGVDIAGRYCAPKCMIDSAHSFNRNMPMNGVSARSLSFHAIKNITTLGEGGAIITNDEIVAERTRLFAQQGRCKEHGDIIGTNWRMTCAQAAMGISQLKMADEFKEKKQRLFDRYAKAFRGYDEDVLTLPENAINTFWHLYIIRTFKRDHLMEYLRTKGIETRIHYKPWYKYNMHLGYNPLPNAENYYKTALSIPLYADMTDAEQNYVIEHIKRGLE